MIEYKTTKKLFKKSFLIKLDELRFRILAIFLITLGISIRLYHFIMNRSIWLDEAMLSNNIINRSYIQLLQPLDERQIAPIGFLMVQKFFISTFGVSEYSLRAFPLIAGILSIILFYFLLRKIGGERFACAGLLFFIFGKLLIYHSTEAKQYYMDVFVFIISYYYLHLKTTDFNSLKSVICKGLLGAILIWFSHCTVFFLASIGIILAIEILFHRNFSSVSGFMIMVVLWLGSFGINYYFFLSNHSSQSIQESAFMVAGYLPPEGSLAGKIGWLMPLLKQSVTYPLNIDSLYPLLILISIGLWFVIVTKEYRLLALILPFLIHILLSFLYIYPFGGRFNLYFGAAAILFISLGLKAVAVKLKMFGLLIALIIITFLIYNPAKYSFKTVEFEEMKSALRYIQEHKNDNDLLYIHFASMPAYRFYKETFPLKNLEIIEGSVAYDGFERDFHLVSGKERVWVLLTHFDESDRKRIMEKSKGKGQLLEQYEYNGALTLLYSFAE